MLIGLIAGILAPDWRGLFFMCLAAPAVRIGLFVANGGAGLWNDYAAMAIVSYGAAAIVGAIVYGIKRTIASSRTSK